MRIVISFMLLVLVASCGGGGTSPPSSGGDGGTSPPVPTVSVTITAPETTVAAGATAQFSAAVTGTSNTAVDWSVSDASGSGSNAGSISSSGLYTAPDYPPTGGAVTVHAVSSADSTASAKTTISILFSNVSIKGAYSFYLAGTNVPSGEQANIAGRFQADGQGHISEGLEDVNASVGGAVTATFDATYTVNSAGHGQMQVTSSQGTNKWDFILVGGNQMKFIDIDVNVLAVGAATPIARTVQDNSGISGSYVFSLVSGAQPVATLGRFVANGAGLITEGDEDVNSQGVTPASLALTGTYNVATNGRGTLTLSAANGVTSHYAFYPDGEGSANLVQIDAGSWGTGMFQLQTSPGFLNSDLNGGFVFYVEGSTSTGTGALTGRLSGDGSGGLQSGELDTNLAGNVVADQAFTGSYSLDSNGRGTATLDTSSGNIPLIVYAVSPQEFLVMVGDNTQQLVLRGQMLAQQDEPFNVSQIVGSFGFAGLAYRSSTLEAIVGRIRSDGAGQLSGDMDVTDGNVLSPADLTGSYDVGNSGRVTAALTDSNNSTRNYVGYIISPTNWVLMEVDQSSYALLAAQRQY